MGKKSRRQRQVSLNQTGGIAYYRRFNALQLQSHKDGSKLSEDDIRRMIATKRAARNAADEMWARPSTIGSSLTHDWLDEYLAAVAYPRIKIKSLDSALRALERWPHLLPYWPRLRRRVCDHCHSRVALSEPRYQVCGGCGVARYCCEECQRADWGWHQSFCEAMARRRWLYQQRGY